MPADPDRQPFYCPYPGCKRKFASLWRLKVHYRAPPNERGSGKERGHGVELPICPACGEELEPGKHHNKCKAGRTTNPPSKRIPKPGSTTTRSPKQRKVSQPASNRRRGSLEGLAVKDEADEIGDQGTEAGNFEPRSSGMLPPLMDVPVTSEAPRHASFIMPPTGFPAFDFDYVGVAAGSKRRLIAPSGVPSPLPALHATGPDAHFPGPASPSAAPARNPPGRDPSLSAQGAAEVLYGINKSESGTNVDTGDAPRVAYHAPTFLVPMPMMHSDGQPALHPSTSLPEGSGPPQLPYPPPRTPHTAAPDGDAAQGMPVAHMAEGIPVDAMGGGMPMMIPWNPDVMGPMPQMVMTPQGMISVVGDGGPYLMPMQTTKNEDGEDVPIAMTMGGMPMQMVGDMLVPMGHPATSEAADGKPGDGAMYMHAGVHLPDGMVPFQHMHMVPVGRDGDGMMCGMAAVSMPDGAPVSGISEEDFRNAMRMAQVPEMSATS